MLRTELIAHLREAPTGMLATVADVTLGLLIEMGR
jgi:hypothetical protein